jgi:hypothetical protein
MEDHKKVFSIQIPIEVEVEVLKLHFKANTEARMVDIINMKLNLMEVDEEILEEEEVVEVMVEVIEGAQKEVFSSIFKKNIIMILVVLRPKYFQVFF